MPAMGIRGFDHLAITVNDVGRTADFYRDVFGAEILYRDRFEDGRFPILTLVLGTNRINVHPSPPRPTWLPTIPLPARSICASAGTGRSRTRSPCSTATAFRSSKAPRSVSRPTARRAPRSTSATPTTT